MVGRTGRESSARLTDFLNHDRAMLFATLWACSLGWGHLAVTVLAGCAAAHFYMHVFRMRVETALLGPVLALASVFLAANYCVCCLALVVLRRREPGTARPFRAWGYPWAPALFCLVSFAIVINTIVEAPGVASAGLAVMAAGVPMYWWVKRGKQNGKRKT